MQSPHILLVVTSADSIGEAKHPTGYWLEEAVAPYYTFIDAHCRVSIASPKGGKAPIAPESLMQDAQTASTKRYHEDAVLQAALAQSLCLRDLNMDDFHGIFFVGGHGAMVDFPNDTDVIRLIEQAYQQQKPVASVCHGPACLVQAKTPEGAPIIQNKRFTCFSDIEEKHIQQEALVPFLLESTLCTQGGIAQNAGIFEANTINDHGIITGQNPASSIGTAEAVIHTLRQKLAA